MRYNAATIEAIRQLLLSQPDVDDAERTVTKKEAVKLLSGAVSQLQRRGYSMQRIAEMLTKEGLKISVPSLKTYLSRSRGRGAKINRGFRPRVLSVVPTPPVGTPPLEKASPNPVTSNQALPKDSTSIPTRPGSFTPRKDSVDI